MKVVIGLGKTGVSCLQYLLDKGEQVVVMDNRARPYETKDLQKAFPTIKMITGSLDQELLLEADEIIVSPGVSLKTPEIAAAIEQGVPCVGDIELFLREVSAPIIAITGSNGKTTLTTLVGDMLKDAGFKVSVCGNIGTPVLDTLDAKSDYYVMELSSFQLETTYSLKAKVAIILNITPDHLDRYDSFQDYAAAKLRIYDNSECAVVSLEEPQTAELSHPKKRTFSLQQTTADLYIDEFEGGRFIFFEKKPAFPLSELTCQGHHHYENTLAALTIGSYLGISMTSMRGTLSRFVGLPHRCQKIGSAHGVDWYNDSKATNIGATIAALRTLSPLYNEIILIAGGDAKGADLSPLGSVAEQCTSHVILIGESADHLDEVLRRYVGTTRADTLEDAVSFADQRAQPKTAVLLSPACASWDMFANFEERGNLFTSAVKERIDAKGSLS